MKFKGISAQLIVGEEGVEIQRGAMGVGGRSNKTLYYNQITAVQYRSASFFSNGYIQFTVPGGMEKKGGSMRAVFDENSVAFGFASRKKFDEAKRLIDERMSSIRSPGSQGKGLSKTEELERLASLVDRGFLSREEFDQHKKNLLG